jgi:type I restriction enzyme, S subunit
MSTKTKTTVPKEEATLALVPKLRFPEFLGAEGWKERPLGDFLSESRLTGSKGNVAKKITVKLWGNGVFEKNDAIQGSINTQYFRRKSGQFIYSKLDFLNQAFGIIPPSLDSFESTVDLPCFDFADGLNSVFLLEYVKRKDFYERLGETADGSRKARRIHAETFLSFPIALPTPPEQQKIAECLSSVDELMAAQVLKVDALKTHKKGLMQQLFPREGETQPRLRFPEFQNAGAWEFTTVGGLVEGGRLFPPKDGNHGNIHPKASDYVSKGIPFIMASDLNGGGVDIENCHFISKDQADALQKGFAEEGDVLLSHKGTVGEVAVVHEIKTPYLMLTPQVTYYRVKDRKKLSNQFLAQLFVSEAFQANLLEVSGGGTRAYIGITEQAKLRLQLPMNVKEQQRIASCLSSLDAFITAESQKHEALKTHKKGLMQQLFPSPEAVAA